MNVLPRSSWTSHVVSPSKQADQYDGLDTFRHPVGISLHAPLVRQSVERTNPVGVFNELWQAATASGHSDIDFNLGATNDSVYSLRGLTNKSSASPDVGFNSSHVSIYVFIGTTDRPSDQLLRTILDARRLVLSRYPTATSVDFREIRNEWLKRLLVKNNYWNTPVGSPSPAYLPEYELSRGQSGIHVQELQELLAYWGLYRKRVDGVFNVQTEDAIIELQANLTDGGYYHHDCHGRYDDALRIAWGKYIDVGQKRNEGVECT